MKALRAIALITLAAALQTAAQAPPGQRALLLNVVGAIGPAISDFVERGIAHAGDAEAAAVILRLDTPGGLDTSMRAIIKSILAARVPVVVYVAPGGARAASAGTYLLYAAHVAAMAPGTNLGAATPVPLGPGTLPGAEPPRDRGAGRAEGEPEAAAPASAMQRKVVNDAVAYIRSLAELRGRNADWAEEAVREGASLSAERALELGVVDVVAPDLPALLRALQGRRVEVAGAAVVLDTAAWTVETLATDWRTEILAVITNPNVAYMLLLLGIYGLLFELYSPGALVPGVVGTIALVLALYALHLLPVNYAGVALILIGVALMGAELYTPGFGVFGTGGVAAFVAGSVMLFDSDAEGLQVSLPLVATVSLAFAGLFVATAILFTRIRRRPVVTGNEQMVGAQGRALEAFTDTGRVQVHGERWAARTGTPVGQGQAVRVLAVKGLTLDVAPLDDAHNEREK